MLTLNPGLVLIAASLFVLGAPKGMRAPTMAGAALFALWLVLDREFGAGSAMAQMGLPVVLLSLDALNRIFGVAMLIATILLALYSGGRRSRYEDGAVLLLSGGAVSALFVGDLVSFVAAAALAALGAAAVVFASGVRGASQAGVRLLIWFGLEGLLLLLGAAFHLSAGADRSVFTRFDVRHIGDAFIFAALLIHVGAPFAHVWFKDAVRHASPTGAVALSAFSTNVGVYALARLFPAEPALLFVGFAMVVLGLLYAIAEDDLRAAAAAGMSAIVGVCVMLIGVGSPLALAGAAAQAFAMTFVFVALQMALGAVYEREGTTRLSSLGGLARRMPLTIVLLGFCGLAASAAPGAALFATLAVVLDALARWDLRWLWLSAVAISPILFVGLAMRPMLAAYSGAAAGGANEAPFPMLLGAAVASFFCISIGVAPGWLYAFMPSEMTYLPLSADRVGLQLELLGAAGLVYACLWALRLAPGEQPRHLWDIDDFYRGPLSRLARWSGVILLRLQGAGQGVAERGLAALSAAAARLAARLDRPYKPLQSAWPQLLVLVAVALITLLVTGQ